MIVLFLLLFLRRLFLSFLMKDKREICTDVTGGGEELRGIDGAKVIIRIYYVRKIICFQHKGETLLQEKHRWKKM